MDSGSLAPVVEFIPNRLFEFCPATEVAVDTDPREEDEEDDTCAGLFVFAIGRDLDDGNS